jgi:two-component system nitrogen regulation response regulator GlnG
VTQDLPNEITGSAHDDESGWTNELMQWAEGELTKPDAAPLLEQALPELERVLIRAALLRARGKRLEAARLLGWGRNTLTRKIKELGMEDAG